MTCNNVETEVQELIDDSNYDDAMDDDDSEDDDDFEDEIMKMMQLMIFPWMKSCKLILFQSI